MHRPWVAAVLRRRQHVGILPGTALVPSSDPSMDAILAIVAKGVQKSPRSAGHTMLGGDPRAQIHVSPRPPPCRRAAWRWPASSPAAPRPIASSLDGQPAATADVIYWHLFGGGDGANMTTMVQDYEKSSRPFRRGHTAVVGQPLLHEAGAGGVERPPARRRRSRTCRGCRCWPGRAARVGRGGRHLDAGITEDKFTPAAWSKATVGGTTYAVPLDTHPFVMFYNLDLARKAGLLDVVGEEPETAHGQGSLRRRLEGDEGGRRRTTARSCRTPRTPRPRGGSSRCSTPGSVARSSRTRAPRSPSTDRPRRRPSRSCRASPAARG